MGRYAERRKAKGESNGFLHLPLSARQLVRALSAKTYTARCCFSMCMLFMRPFTFTRAAFYSTCLLLLLLPYACDQIHSSRLFQLLLGTLSILHAAQLWL